MLKRTVLLVVVLALLIQPLGICSFTAAAQTPENLLTNGSFESPLDAVPPRICNVGWTESTLIANTWGRVFSGVTPMERITADGFSDADSAVQNGSGYLSSGTTSAGQFRGLGQIVQLPADTYQLSFFAKCSSPASMVKATVQVPATVNSGVLLATTSLQQSALWKKYTLTFTVTDAGYYLIGFGGNSDNNATPITYAIDSVELHKSSDFVTITANAEFGGTVTGGGSLLLGSTATLNAVPKSGFAFAGWSDGEPGATRIITVQSDMTYTATFARNSADRIINGNFEADDWSVRDIWTPLSNNTIFERVSDPLDSANHCVKATGGVTSSIALRNVNLTAGQTYVFSFRSYIASAVSGSGASFYRAGFYNTGTEQLLDSAAISRAYIYSADSVGLWKKISITYSPSETGPVDVILGFYNASCTSDWYLDDITLCDKTDYLDISVTANYGGTASISGSPVRGNTMTLTATPFENFTFTGWAAKNGDIVSTSESYSFTAIQAEEFTGLFSMRTDNLIADGNFELGQYTTENITTTQQHGIWGRINSTMTRMSQITTDAFQPADSNALNGTAYMQSGVTDTSSAYYRTWGQTVTLDANTDYLLSFYAKNQMQSAPVYGGIQRTGNNASTTAALTSTSVCRLETGSQWKRYIIRFNSGSYTVADVAFGGMSTGVADSGSYAVDNVSLYKYANIFPAGDGIVGGTFESGNANGWTAVNGTVSTVTAKSWIISPEMGAHAATLTAANSAQPATLYSPAFSVVPGTAYEMVFYSRHNDTANRPIVTVSVIDTQADTALASDLTLSRFTYDTGGFANTGTDNRKISEGNTEVSYDTATSNLGKYVLSFTPGAKTVRLKITISGESANFDGFTYYQRTDMRNAVASHLRFNGTAIRTSGTQGLRFKSELNLLALENFDCMARVVEYGTIAMRDDALSGSELTCDGSYNVGTTVKTPSFGVAYSAANGTQHIHEQFPDSLTFTGVLINIEPDNYELDYTARGYLKLRYADGSISYAYTDPQTTSIQTLSDYILTNRLETEAVRQYLKENIADVIESIKADPTDKWEGGFTHPELQIEAESNATVQNAQAPVMNNYRGFSSVIYQLYTYMPYVTHNEFTEKQAQIQLDRMQEIGIRYVRSDYNSYMTWDGKTSVHDYESTDYIKAFYKEGLELKERDIDICITTGWSLHALIDDSSTIPSKALYVADDWNATLNNWSTWMTNSILHFRANGLTNLNGLLLFTEPCKVGWTDTYYADSLNKWIDCARALDTSLKQLGLRNEYQIIGPNQSIYKSDPIPNYMDRCALDYMLTNANDYVDVFTSHAYIKPTDLTQNTVYELCEQEFGTYLDIMAAHGSTKEFWIDEWNVSSRSKDPLRGTQFGVCAAWFMNNGISNSILWSLLNQQWPNLYSSSGEFTDGVQMSGLANGLNLAPQYDKNYYAFSLLSRYFRDTGTTYSVQYNTEDGIYYGFATGKNGQKTLLVVNATTQEAGFHLSFTESLGGIKLYRHVYDPNQISVTTARQVLPEDKAFFGVDDTLNDTLPAGGLAIYTTGNLRASTDVDIDVAE